MIRLDGGYVRYGRELEGNPYLLERPRVALGVWETAQVVAAEIYLRLVLGVVTAVVVFFLMIHEYTADSEIGRYLREDAPDVAWRLVPFLAGAAVALFPWLLFWVMNRSEEHW